MIYFAQNKEIFHSEHIKMATNMAKYLQNLGHDRHHQGINSALKSLILRLNPTKSYLAAAKDCSSHHLGDDHHHQGINLTRNI